MFTIVALSRDWGEADMGSVCSFIRVSGVDNENVLDLDGLGGYTTLWIYQNPLNCTLRKSWLSYVDYISATSLKNTQVHD